MGYWGEGDATIFTAIGVCWATIPKELDSIDFLFLNNSGLIFPISLLLNQLIIGAMFSVIYMGIMILTKREIKALLKGFNFSTKELFSRRDGASLVYTGECSYISFGADEDNLHTFTFEMEADSDIMNSIPPSGEEPITGTIIGNTGNLIVADDSVEQGFNVYGGDYARALGKNLFNKSLVLTDRFVNFTDGTIGVITGWYASDYLLIKGFNSLYLNILTPQLSLDI